MEKEKIIEKLESMWKDPKKKGFVKHLIYSYIPINQKANKFVDLSEGTRCSISGEKIINAFKMAKLLIENTDIFEIAKSHLAGIESESRKNAINIHKEYKIAVGGQKTNTFIAEESLYALNAFVTNKLLHGDKDINFIINKVRSGIGYSSNNELKKKMFKANPNIKDMTRDEINNNIDTIVENTKNNEPKSMYDIPDDVFSNL